MNIKKSVAALALGLGVVAGANAMDHDLGLITPPVALSQIVSVGAGSFSDNWIFDIADSVSSGGSVSNMNISVNGSVLYNISDLSVQLYSNTDTLLFDLDLNPGSSANFKYGSGVFPAGDDYYFKISGTADGSLGGQYVFAVSAPVPEPESYAMLLAGLGIIGAAARRRTAR